MVSYLMENPFKAKSVEAIFKELYEAQADGVFRFCYFKLHDRERAKELMQEAFMKTWGCLAEGKKIDNIKAYIYRTAHNLTVNELTRSKHSLSLDLMSEETGFDPKDPLPLPHELSEHRIIVELIYKLEKPYSDILVLRYLGELTVKEIAEALKEKENVISVRIHRALKKLKELYI